MEIIFKPTKKQHIAWMYLQDKVTNHILFGGGVGGGKSYIGCMWIFISALQYPSTRWLIGRSRLTTLKRTTLNTLKDIFKQNNFKNYEINNQTNIITFSNGSEIMLSDLYPYPADAEYDRLGSLEITGAFIDELSEISYKGFEVITSRIRYKLKEYNLIPKLFCASNPYQGWSKNYFYVPFIEGREEKFVKFISALASDNEHLSKIYVETLEKTLDAALKQRLLYGNWNFDGDIYNLFEYEKLQQTFYNDFFENNDNNSYITVDVGDLGNDKTVIGLWKGWNCVSVIKLTKNETTQVVEHINKLRIEYKIPISNIIIDSVGVGAGVASMLKGCIRFAGSEKALNGEKFKNIKAQLFYKFAEKINRLEINFNFKYDDNIVQECLLYKKVFTNEQSSITPKDEIKKKLGRSPDIIDSLYLRAYWEFKTKNFIYIY